MTPTDKEIIAALRRHSSRDALATRNVAEMVEHASRTVEGWQDLASQLLLWLEDDRCPYNSDDVEKTLEKAIASARRFREMSQRKRARLRERQAAQREASAAAPDVPAPAAPAAPGMPFEGYAPNTLGSVRDDVKRAARKVRKPTGAPAPPDQHVAGANTRADVVNDVRKALRGR